MITRIRILPNPEQNKGGKEMFRKFMKALKKGHRKEEGITGLETAIILIAFVTVAAVFGYAVLSAGIYSAEKGKETVYLGLQEAKSTMEITGSVVSLGDNSTQLVTSILFTVRNAVAGEPIDVTEPGTTDANKCILSYIDNGQYHNDVTWTLQWVGYNDGDTLLEIGEKAEITFSCLDIDGSSTALSPGLGVNSIFTMEFKPPSGAVITIERITPPWIDTVMDLH